MAQEESLIRMAISRGVSIPAINKGRTNEGHVTNESNNGGIDDHNGEKKDKEIVSERLLPVASNYGDSLPEDNENGGNVTNERSEGDKGK